MIIKLCPPPQRPVSLHGSKAGILHSISKFSITKWYLFITCAVLICSCKKMEPGSGPLPTPDTQIPKLVTNEATALSQFSVTLGGKLVDSGGVRITELGIVVDTVPHPTTVRNYGKYTVTQPNIDGTFTLYLTYVPSHTTFYVRTYAINAFGTGYGNEVSFTSLEQRIFNGNVALTTQQQVVDFGANHYTTINGSLDISGSVSDLSPLLGLAIVNAGFNARQTLLTNFRGLDSLEITGAIFPNDFWVDYNDHLINFAGLSKLRITRGTTEIHHNNALLNLDGLDSYIAASAGELYIGYCPHLQNINGLRNLTFVGDDLTINSNPVLTDLSGLQNLVTITGRCYILANSSLTTLAGMEKIQSLPKGIEIDDNPVLFDITGLRNLSSIQNSLGLGAITIKGNPLITNIGAFNHISTVDYVEITNNKNLLNLEGLNNLQSVTSGIHIENDSSLIDLTGLENIRSTARVEIFNNTALQNLHGLDGLTQITNNSYSILILRNNVLQSLGGLENVIRADGSVQISYNPLLTDFCPLKRLFAGGYNQFYTATGNASNPSQSQVIANCP